MRRTDKPRQKIRQVIALIVDGKDEQWYMEKVRQFYQDGRFKSLRIEPDLPQKKSIRELLEMAHTKVVDGASDVILCIDLDDLLKSEKKAELNYFRDIYSTYLMIRGRQEVSPRLKKKYGWLEQVLIVINNPCLEYWYLLHFSKTKKFYAAFEPELKKDLRKLPQMEHYEKSQEYYLNSPDIYHRLGGDDGIAKAVSNAHPFRMDSCENEGCSEMGQIFAFLEDKLAK